ncbi:hypothetical protein J1N35_034683 [Gossypium stocksii]|uniref:Uncharacterized protein n=1 Tax=Gossypium stocksii TaxID=47602 RepID=A0A9D3ZQD1_9ROSI|nr:hypothetical protein J1N35_034683 [Gossypium stocksii]
MAWKTKFKDTQTKCTQLEGEVRSLKESESSLNEQLKAQEQRYKADLDGLR